MAREARPARPDAGFVVPIRVYYEDTDATGSVYHANYLRYAERARTELLRRAGIEQTELRRQTGVTFAVSRCDVDYLAPAALDDTLEVHTYIDEIGGASIRAEQVVRRGDRALARLRLRIACVGPDGRPARLPKGVRTALGAFGDMDNAGDVN